MPKRFISSMPRNAVWAWQHLGPGVESAGDDCLQPAVGALGVGPEACGVRMLTYRVRRGRTDARLGDTVAVSLYQRLAQRLLREVMMTAEDGKVRT